MRRSCWSVLVVAACGGSGDATSSAFWTRDVSDAPVAADSASILAGLRAAGGWGHGDQFSIDFSFDVLRADASTPRRMFTPNEFFFTPDCDREVVPVPKGGNVEGEPGYECRDDGDCHLLVIDADAGTLHEMWKADIVDAYFDGGCLAVWQTDWDYGPELRGDQCASADGAGFPITPLLFSADEVAAGSIDHAIRFVLPNSRVRRAYVRPATHATDTTGPANGPPYGVHLRLRADYPVESLPSEGARVVARALQRYGMFHADGGEWTLTAQTDRYTTARWDGLLAEGDLAALQVEDFEVIDHGPSIGIRDGCRR